MRSGPGGGKGICRPRSRLPGQLIRARRAGQAGEHRRDHMRLFRGIRGERLPV
jgi:hypothetical protein